MPIISSGAGPALLLALGGALGWLPPDASHLLAAAIVVLRLGVIGVSVRRISGQEPPVVVLWSGSTLALVGVIIVALKVAFAH